MTIFTSIIGIVIVVLLGTIGYFVKKILDKTESIEGDVKPLTPALIEIQGKFTEAGHSILFPLALTSKSPLSLTEYGRKIIQESDFDKILKRDGVKFINLVKAKNPQSNYDIQEYSIEVMKNLFASNDMLIKSLKDYLYQSGQSSPLLVRVTGVALRDEVMKELKF